VDRIRFGRVDEIQAEEDGNENEGSDPCVLQRISLPLLEECFGFPPFREGFLAISLILRLLNVSLGPIW